MQEIGGRGEAARQQRGVASTTAGYYQQANDLQWAKADVTVLHSSPKKERPPQASRARRVTLLRRLLRRITKAFFAHAADGDGVTQTFPATKPTHPIASIKRDVGEKRQGPLARATAFCSLKAPPRRARLLQRGQSPDKRQVNTYVLSQSLCFCPANWLVNEG